MKRISSVTILIVIITTVFLLLPSCKQEHSQKDNTDNVTGVIFVNYVKSYENLGELAKDADLIVVGAVDRTEVVLDEATQGSEDPRAQIRKTKSSFRIEQSIKGDFTDEIIIVQMGAKGWLEEQGNPIFQTGERCFLFLRGDEDGIYRLVHPDGRFRIEDDNVSSMNFVLPAGQARPPIDLKFWRIDLDDFISMIIETIKSDFIIPDEEPVVSMDLSWVMSGRNDDLSIYQDGTVVFIKQWAMRMSTPDHPPMKAWRVGQISTEDVENLFYFLNSVGFNDLEEYTQAPEPSGESGVICDLYATISAHNGNTDNSITAFGYFPPESHNPYQKLPYPLDEIYTKLIRISEEETKEVYREEMEPDIVFEYPDGDDE